MNLLADASLSRSCLFLRKGAIFLIVGLFGMLLAGCGQPDSEAQEETPPLMPAAVVDDTPAPHPAVATELAAVLPTVTFTPAPGAAAGGTPSPAADEEQESDLAGGTATATPECQPPPNWVLYTVRPLDTLLFLAGQTDVTVEAIKAANCKEDDLLIVGDELYLPSIPPIFPTVPPPTVPPTPVPRAQPPAPAPAVSLPVCSRFRCPIGVLETAPVNTGDPAGTDIHCDRPQDGQVPQSGPWINFDGLASNENEIELGQRTYFYICDFATPDAIKPKAVLVWSEPESTIEPEGTRVLDVLTTSPHPKIKMGDAQGIILWEPICDAVKSYPTGKTYSLVVYHDQENSTPPLKFKLLTPGKERILTLPQVAPTSSGTKFDVYFCGYDGQKDKYVYFDFYVEQEDGKRQLGFSDKVLIDGDGHGHYRDRKLESNAGDPQGSYLIIDKDPPHLDGWDRIWLDNETARDDEE